MRFWLFIIFFFACVCLSAQVRISGEIISSKNKEAIIGATIQDEGTSTGAISDVNGKFELSNLPEQNNYRLKVSYLGYGSQQIIVDRKNASNELNLIVKLKEDSQKINEVEIVGKSKSTEVNEGVQNVNSIDVKALAYRSTNTLQLLNNSSGIRVSQRGGLGSDANISINGIAGKQVKLFVDGIPLDNVGYFTDFYSLPVSQIDRVEVYKGVIPVSLGADALGGAINLITKDVKQNYFEISSEIASFNTIRSSLFSKLYIPKTPLSIAVNAYHNQSENNYAVRGEVRRKDFTTYTDNFKRFHDAFSSRMVQVQFAVNKTKWADLLSVSYKASGAAKELQQNPYFLKLHEVFAFAEFKEQSKKVELRYEKGELLGGRLSFKTYNLYGKINAQLIDTGRSDYDWTGNPYQRQVNGAEISGTQHTLDLNTFNLLNRSLLGFKLNKHFSIELNSVLSNVEQKGQDTSAAKRGTKKIEDIYTIPQYLRKYIAGTAIKSNFWNNRIQHEVGAKYYEVAYRITEAPGLLTSTSTSTSVKSNSKGAFTALKIDIVKDRLAIKTSYEHAARLPDQYEVLGDRVFIIPNPKLKPEISNNFNAGIKLNTLGKLGALQFDANYFFRHSKNNIFLIISAISQYQNIATVRSQGIESDITYSPLPFLRLSGNVTFQDLRNYSDTTATNPTVNKRYYKARLPNKPIFFSNAEVNVFYPNLIKDGDKIQLYYWANYTDKFYRTFAIDGDPAQKERIPTQLIQNIGIAYAMPLNFITLSAEVHNLENKAAFDYFSIQKPGKSFHLKVSVSLNQSITNQEKTTI